jgi:putative salt-induced outer membrane protein YdiY
MIEGSAVRGVALAVLFTICGLAPAARGQVASLFPAGTVTLTSTGSYAHSFDSHRVAVGTYNVGAGYYIFNNFALNLEAGYQYHDQSGPNANVVMLDMLFRHHLLHWKRFSFFIDFGLGVSYADERTPPHGTYFNFMEEAGLGSTFQIKDNLHLLTGVRYFHMSNARIDGPEHNPSLNAWQVYAGIMFKL